MRWRWPRFQSTRIGIALSGDRVVAVVPGDDATTPWVRALTPPGEGDLAWPDLAAALGELRAAVAGGGRAEANRAPFRGVLHVALLPPLVEVRRVELPGLKLVEARQVLRREPSRYLARSADAATLELEVAGSGWRQSSPFDLVAASKGIVDCVGAAARDSGWRLAGITGAEGAWAAAASSLLPAAKEAERTLGFRLADRLEIVRVRHGRPVAVRRFPLGDEPRLTLDPGGVDGVRVGAAAVSGRETSALLAARFAVRATGPSLLPERERAVLERKARRANVIRFAAAAALLVGAVAVQLWGLSREQGAIAAERARLREPVTRALAVRDSLGRVSNRLSTIRAVAATRPRWAPLIVALSSRLPDDAFLLSLRADGDSLHLEGSAARAEGVFDALRDLSEIGTLRPAGPIRQEIAEDGSTSERFSLSARVAREP